MRHRFLVSEPGHGSRALAFLRRLRPAHGTVLAIRGSGYGFSALAPRPFFFAFAQLARHAYGSVYTCTAVCNVFAMGEKAKSRTLAYYFSGFLC